MIKKILFCILIFIYNFIDASTHITSNTVYVEYQKQIFTFTGNVMLNAEDMNLLSNELQYKKNNITALGNIRLNFLQDDLEIYSDKLERHNKKTTISMNQQDGFVRTIDNKNQRNILSQKIFIEETSKDNNIIHFQGTPTLIDKDMKVTSEKEFIYNKKESQTNFLGKTKFEDINNHTNIQSENIIFMEKSHKLLFNSSVSITDPNNHYLSGDTGDYNTDSQFLNLSKNVHYIGDIARITSERLRTDEHKNSDTNKIDKVYFFEDNIGLKYQEFIGSSRQVMVSPDENYTELIDNVFLKGSNGLEIRCDLMDIVEKEKKSYLYNHVVLVDGDRKFYGDTAIYDDKTKIFSIQGSAKYISSDNQYKAQIIYLDSKDLSVKFVGQVSGTSALEGLKGIKVDTEH